MKMTKISARLKKCYGCQCSKLLHHFNPNPDKKDGLHNKCKTCEALDPVEKINLKKREKYEPDEKRIWCNPDEIYC